MFTPDTNYQPEAQKIALPPLQLFDTNNFLRKRYEADKSGLALRNLFNLAFYSPEPMIFVCDPPDAKNARKTLYPEYKGHRKPTPDEFHVTLGIFKELIGHTNKMVLEVPGYEADDVIATLVRTSPGVPLVINSNDGDYLPLCNDLVKMTEPPALKHIAVEDLRLYKTLVGDSSDNIKGVKLFGPKGFEALGDNRKAIWTKWLNANPWKKLADGGTLLPDVADLGLTDTQYEWFKGNIKTIQAYWQIVNFVSVDNELMMKHLKVGTPNWARGDELLKEIMQ